VTAGSLATPHREAGAIGATVPMGTKIIDAAPQVLASTDPVGVVDDAGRLMGVLPRDEIINLVLERPAA
jgi:hypothetical protein